MTADDESPKSPEAEAPAKRPRPRRGRRGGRGRGRGRRPAGAAPEAVAEADDVRETSEPSNAGEILPPSAEPVSEEMPLADSPIEEARREAAEADEADEADVAEATPELRERYEEPRPAERERRDFRPASPPAIADAIVEVNHIISDLKRVLDAMEEVLETLELAEVQKNVDEREIESLRQALRHLDRRSPEQRREREREREHEGGRSPQPHAREPRRDRRR